MLEKYGNDPEEDSFKIYFLLANGKKVIATDACDKKGEGTKAFETLKYLLPEEISFGEISTY